MISLKREGRTFLTVIFCNDETFRSAKICFGLHFAFKFVAAGGFDLEASTWTRSNHCEYASPLRNEAHKLRHSGTVFILQPFEDQTVDLTNISSPNFPFGFEMDSRVAHTYVSSENRLNFWLIDNLEVLVLVFELVVISCAILNLKLDKWASSQCDSSRDYCLTSSHIELKYRLEALQGTKLRR